MADRRTFLSITLAAGAGATLLAQRAGFETALRWCLGPAHPLAEKRLIIDRGGLPAGCRAQVELLLVGPGFKQPELIDSLSLQLTQAVTEWPLVLAWEHPTVEPGQYRYQAVMTVGDKRFVSDEISYRLNPFRFGV
jgi:hypothetical protein